MKTRALLSHALLLCSLVLVLNTSLKTSAIPSQEANKPKVSEGEDKALKAVEAAPDVNAKLAAADEFLKKYPKSGSRPQVIEYLVEQIVKVPDPNQKLALAQRFPTVFSQPGEGDAIKPALIDAYVHLNRFDEAFASGAAYLANNANDIQVLIVLAVAGTEQAKNRNAKYVNESRQYGTKAIELLEANKKPASMSDAVWEKQKALLPAIYQEMAVISLLQQKPVEAQAQAEKAVTLNPADPFNYVLLASITNDDYQKMVQTYKSMPDGKAKDEMLQKATALIDKAIDQYAHAVALSEGKPQYQALHDQVLQDLATYYKFRHNNSTDGMQKLIDSYKRP
jgi:hypothetical protein